MSFTDNFDETGPTNLEDRTPSGGGAWTLVSGAAGAAVVAANVLKANSTTASVYTCTDQGSADQVATFRSKIFATTNTNSFVCISLVDVDNFIGWRLNGTGSTGRRLTKRVAGVNTDLITSQGVDEEWIKLERSGHTVKFYQGGTGASPSWTPVGADQTVTNFSGETSQGVRTADSSGNAWIDDIELAALAGAATSYVMPRSAYKFQHLMVR